jgi:DNA-binding CsgD family transcriptional regulator
MTECRTEVNSPIIEIDELSFDDTRASQAIVQTVSTMSPLARETVVSATALGHRFSFEDLSTLVGRSLVEMLSPVDEAIRAGVFVESGPLLAFGRDEIFEAVRRSVSDDEICDLDGRAIRVLLESGSISLEIAERLASRAHVGDETAIKALSVSSQEMGATDPSVAAKLGRQALDLMPDNHPDRQGIAVQTAMWLHAAALGGRAEKFAQSVLLQGPSPDQECEVRVMIAAMFSLSPETRVHSCLKGLEREGVSPYWRALLGVNLQLNLLEAGRVRDARGNLEVARSAVAATDQIYGRFLLELSESMRLQSEGRFDEALGSARFSTLLGREASEERLSEPNLRVLQARRQFGTQWLCEALISTDRIDESMKLLESTIEEEREVGQVSALKMHELARARLLLELGRISESLVILSDYVALARANENVGLLDAAGVVAAGRAAIHANNKRLATQTERVARVMLDQKSKSVRCHAAWLLSLLALAKGDPRQARLNLELVGEHGAISVLPRLPYDASDATRLVRIALDVGDHLLALHAVNMAQRIASQNPSVVSALAAALHTTGLANRSRSDLYEAIGLYGQGVRVLAHASALEDLGNLEIEEAAISKGLDKLDRSLAIYAKSGAMWDASRVRSKLRSLGVHRRIVVERPTRGWTAMTMSERAVARLVSEGLSNREVSERLHVSQHTVSAHLGRAYAKLGVRSRTELTRLSMLNQSVQ